MSKLSWAPVGRDLVFIRYDIEMPEKDGSDAQTFLNAISERRPFADKPEQTLKEDFKADLQKCSEGVVSPAATNKLFSGQPSIATAGQRLVISYLDYIEKDVRPTGRRKDKCDELRKKIKAELQKTSDTNVGRQSNSKKKNHQQGNSEETNTGLFKTLLDAYKILLKSTAQSADEQEYFINNVFPDLDSYDEKYANAAYFVVFRQSTRPGEVIKSFIAILSPAENGLGFFSYVHVLKGSNHNITKTTRGFISHLAAASYFVGLIWRNGNKDPKNHEVLVLERNMLSNATPLLYGLIMTSAASNQPIIARIVLLRIGDRRSLEGKIRHEDIKPMEFKVEGTRNVIQGLMESVPKGFKHIDLGKLDDLVAEIKSGIQNVFGANRVCTEEEEEKNLTRQGALQTFPSVGLP